MPIHIERPEHFDQLCTEEGLTLLSGIEAEQFSPYQESATALCYQAHEFESLDQTRRWVEGCTGELGFRAFALIKQEEAQAMLWFKTATEKDMRGDVCAFVSDKLAALGLEAPDVVYCHNLVVDSHLRQQGVSKSLGAAALDYYTQQHPHGALLLCRISPDNQASMAVASRIGCQSSGIYDRASQKTIWWGSTV